MRHKFLYAWVALGASLAVFMQGCGSTTKSSSYSAGSIAAGTTAESSSVGPTLESDAGSQGPAGTQGNTGATGPAGVTGYTGPIGDQGSPGDTGATGPQGPQGATGAIGPQGPAGDTGAEGPQGEVGSDGAVGAQGDIGDVGPQGDQGPVGVDGAQGPQGDPGDQGNVGAQGDVGLPGFVGAVGLQGPKGDTGLDGAQGPPGVMGPMGPQGQQGDTGDQGPQGFPGLDGVVGFQGPAGIVGPAGPVGWPGAPGQNGRDGQDGQQGPKGPPGLVGLQGSQGDPGDPGQVGLVGSVGVDGAIGPPGLAGITGSQGPQGVQGVPGVDGAMGPAGPQGPDGPQGPHGDSGPVGPMGSSSGSSARGADLVVVRVGRQVSECSGIPNCFVVPFGTADGASVSVVSTTINCGSGAPCAMMQGLNQAGYLSSAASLCPSTGVCIVQPGGPTSSSAASSSSGASSTSVSQLMTYVSTAAECPPNAPCTVMNDASLQQGLSVVARVGDCISGSPCLLATMYSTVSSGTTLQMLAQCTVIQTGMCLVLPARMLSIVGGNGLVKSSVGACPAGQPCLVYLPTYSNGQPLPAPANPQFTVVTSGANCPLGMICVILPLSYSYYLGTPSGAAIPPVVTNTNACPAGVCMVMSPSLSTVPEGQLGLLVSSKGSCTSAPICAVVPNYSSNSGIVTSPTGCASVLANNRMCMVIPLFKSSAGVAMTLAITPTACLPGVACLVGMPGVTAAPTYPNGPVQSVLSRTKTDCPSGVICYIVPNGLPTSGSWAFRSAGAACSANQCVVVDISIPFGNLPKNPLGCAAGSRCLMVGPITALTAATQVQVTSNWDTVRTTAAYFYVPNMTSGGVLNSPPSAQPTVVVISASQAAAGQTCPAGSICLVQGPSALPGPVQGTKPVVKFAMSQCTGGANCLIIPTSFDLTTATASGSYCPPAPATCLIAPMGVYYGDSSIMLQSSVGNCLPSSACLAFAQLLPSVSTPSIVNSASMLASCPVGTVCVQNTDANNPIAAGMSLPLYSDPSQCPASGQCLVFNMPPTNFAPATDPMQCAIGACIISASGQVQFNAAHVLHNNPSSCVMGTPANPQAPCLVIPSIPSSGSTSFVEQPMDENVRNSGVAEVALPGQGNPSFGISLVSRHDAKPRASDYADISAKLASLAETADQHFHDSTMSSKPGSSIIQVVTDDASGSLTQMSQVRPGAGTMKGSEIGHSTGAGTSLGGPQLSSLYRSDNLLELTAGHARHLSSESAHVPRSVLQVEAI